MREAMLYERFEKADSGIEAGLFAIAMSINELAIQVNRLGLNNAATEMGAIEALSKNLGDKIAEAGEEIAAAIEGKELE